MRASAADSYGQGRKQTMLFKEFMQQLRGGATNLYLSTQEVGAVAAGPAKLSAMRPHHRVHVLSSLMSVVTVASFSQLTEAISSLEVAACIT